MDASTRLVLLLVILTNLGLLGGSRLTGLIRVVAAQGILLGVLPLLTHAASLTPHLLAFACGAGLLKGVVFPALLLRAARDAHVRREVEPYVGLNLSLAAGVLALAVSFWLAARLPSGAALASRLALPAAFMCIFTGLFLIVARRKALSQVLGYLVLENGIYLFGVSLGQEVPFVVELGVLLDVFLAVFVMGIALFHIGREFDDLDVGRMTALKDWTP